jgi:hypothetical protein
MTTLKFVRAAKLFYFFVSRKIATTRVLHPGTDSGSLFIG